VLISCPLETYRNVPARPAKRTLRTVAYVCYCPGSLRSADPVRVGTFMARNYPLPPPGAVVHGRRAAYGHLGAQTAVADFAARFLFNIHFLFLRLRSMVAI
jgi:hypothetical protein